jgi:eukaryotic-like serine/threonine-protein kinase
MLETPSRYPAPGEIIDGKYRIDRLLGEGGMGAVMGAYHMMLRAPVALKFISPDMLRVPGAVERFLNEGVAARNIRSDHVVRIDDVGRLPTGLPYIVMEMLAGCDLSELLEREGVTGLPVPRAVHFVLQILRGLHVAHSAGIIHRDLKPSNAFVITNDGEGDFVKLLDFGISKVPQEREGAQQLTQTNTGLGTPLYMSPEQARNAREATPRSDLYSVSAILFELLTGRTPYIAETPNDLLFKLFTAEPDSLKGVRPDLPDALCDIVHSGLSKDPEGRPGSALEYAELISPFADERSNELIGRLRAAGTSPSTVRNSLPRGPSVSQLPQGSGLDQTVVASSMTAPVVPARKDAQAPANGQVAKSAATQLNMGDAEAAAAPPRQSRGLMFAGGALLLVGLGFGGAVAMRGTGSAGEVPAASAVAPVASPPPTPQVSAAPAPSGPTVTPIAASAVASAAPPEASATAPKIAKPIGRPPVTGTGSKNPFNVGIVQ